MKLYGLLGHKIGYSLSPSMHKAAFSKLKIKADYTLFDVDPAKVDEFLNGILRNDIAGLNVTVPYKIKAFEFIKKYGVLDKNCIPFGAINTINVKNKSLYGYNTDTVGFARSLEIDLGFDPAGKKVFVFGAGGAGSACAMELARVADTVYITDVEPDKIRDFSEKFLRYYGTDRLNVVSHNAADIGKALKACELVVNATPFGRNRGELVFDTEHFHSNMFVYDLIYKPSPTPIVEEALKFGLKASNGLGMLLYQGAEAFGIWTGRKAPVDTMRKALVKALKVGS